MFEETSFGQILRERRNTLGLTQSELARRVGCAAISIRKIEADSLRPSVQLAELIALALNIPEDDQFAFVRLARAEPPPAPIPTPSPSPGEIGHMDLSGRAVKGFQLGEKIGSGGFGVVYRAMQPSVGRDVAVKIILPRYANHPNFIRRFEAEAHLIALLEHPHIVPLYDYWREPQAAYLIMRLLRGGSLESQLRNGPIPLPLLAQYVHQIGLALDVAHRQGIVHRDIKPANVLLDDEDNAYLADFGIARHLVRDNAQSGAKAAISGRSPAYISPEQIRAEPIKPQSDIYCLGIMMFEMLTGRKPFVGPTPVAYIQQHLNDPLPSVRQYNPALSATLDHVLQIATARDIASRYRDVPALLQAFQQAVEPAKRSILRRSLPETAAPELTSHAPAPPVNPYKGLRAFDEADASQFYGRDTLIQELFDRLSEESDIERFLAIVGPSGSGKSSVVKAGLVPALRQGGLPGSENWFILDFTPGTHPWEEIEAALLRVAANALPALLPHLRDGEDGLLEVIGRILPEDDETELLLIIDQFEELFTLVEDEAVREQFLNSLVAAILAAQSRLRVIVTLRADFYDRPLQYVDFGDLLRQRSVSVLPMTPDELEQAIHGPLSASGIALEPGLAAAISREVGAQPGTLPLLQYVLTELFDRREGNLMTWAAYEAVGGVAGALSRRADSLYDALDEAGRAMTRQLFLRLVTPSDSGEDTRRRVPLSEMASIVDGGQAPMATSATQLSHVIDTFARYRLLSFDRDPDTRTPTVEVAHEALLRSWERLRIWLDESRNDIRRQRQLATTVDQWHDAGRDTSYLLRGNRLHAFATWATDSSVMLTAAEANFLQASLAAGEADQREEQARQQRELQSARRLAETQSKLAAEQSLASRRLRHRAYVLAGALVLVAFLALVALVNGNRAAQSAAEAADNLNLASSREAEAIQNAELAARQQLEAETEARARTTAEASAIQERESAEQLARLTSSRELALAALNNLPLDPELSILLALQALAFAPTREATEALHQGLQTSRILMRLEDAAAPVWGVAFSPDGAFVAAVTDDGSAEGRIFIWIAASGELRRTITYQGDVALGHTLRFDAAGNRLALVARAGDDGVVVQTWDIQSGAMLTKVALPGVAGNVQLSSDWRLVATGASDGIVSIWDAQTAELLLWLTTGANDPVIAFSPDNTRLAVAGLSGQVAIWEFPASLAAPTGQPPAAFRTSLAGDVRDVWIDHTSTRLFLERNGGRLELWDPGNTGGPQTIFAGHSALVNGLAIQADGSRLASAGTEGAARVWEVATGTELFALTGHDGFVTDVAFSPAGDRLATAGVDGSVRIWNTATFAGGDSAGFTAVAGIDLDLELSPDEQTIALGNGAGPATVWDVATGELLFTLRGYADSGVNRLSYHPDGSRLASAGADQMIRVWSLTDGAEILSFLAHDDAVAGGLFRGAVDVAYSPDGTRLASAGADGLAKVWDATSGELLLTLAGHSAGLHSLAYSPDGLLIATASDNPDTSVKVWDAQTGAELYSFGPNPDRALALAFNQESKLLAVGGQGGYLKVWDLRTGNLAAEMTGQPGTIGSVHFLPDGRRLVSGGATAISVWDLSSGTELVTIAPYTSFQIAISRTGTRLYGTSTDGEQIGIRSYILSEPELLALARSRLTRTLTPAECRQYLHQGTCP